MKQGVGSRVIALVYITNPSRVAAVRLARQLLARRLIACANIHASRSFYRWQGKRVAESEHILVVKTTPGRVAAVRAEAARLHPYQVPCILHWPAAANAAYAAWVRQAVRSR